MDDKIKPQNFSPTSQKKRVLFVITQSEFGGAQRFLYDFITHLDKARFEPFLAVGITGDGELAKTLSGQLPIYTLVKLTRDISPWQDLAAAWELRKLIKKLRPDVLFLNSSKAGFVGSLAAAWPRAIPRLKVIYRIGGWGFNDPWPQWKKRLIIFLEQFSAKWKNIIIVNNNHDFIQAQQLALNRKKVYFWFIMVWKLTKSIFSPEKKLASNYSRKLLNVPAKFFKLKSL